MMDISQDNGAVAYMHAVGGGWKIVQDSSFSAARRILYAIFVRDFTVINDDNMVRTLAVHDNNNIIITWAL